MAEVQRVVACARLLFAIALAFSSYPATAQVREGGGLPQILMALADWDAIHAQLVERCRDIHPETERPLRAGIATWTTRNQDALTDIRRLMRDGMLGEGVSQREIDARFAQIARKVTQFMLETLTESPATALTEVCLGGHANQLGGRGADFVSLRDRMKAELEQKTPRR